MSMDDIYCSALEVHQKIVTLKCLCTVCKGVYTHIHINIFLKWFYSFSDKIIPPTFEEGFKIIKIVRDGKVAEVIENE